MLTTERQTATSQGDEKFINCFGDLKGNVAGPRRSAHLERAPETGLSLG